MTEPISVTALNQYIKGLLDRDRLLSQVLVRSEISNYKVYPSGHHYFSLKDAESSIRCVMFRREAGTFYAHRKLTIGLATVVAGVGLWLFSFLGTEFTNSIAAGWYRME